LGHGVNGTHTNSTLTSKRATADDIVQAIEAALGAIFTVAKKRDVAATITDVLQSLLEEAGPLLGDLKRDTSSDDLQDLFQQLEALGLTSPGSDVGSNTQRSVEDRSFKLPEISPSVTSGLTNAASVATIGGGLAKIWEAVDGSSSSTSTKREWNIAVDGVGPVRPAGNADPTQFEDRAVKIPASLTTWLKNIGNVASIGAGGAAIVGAVDGSSNSTLKREPQVSDGVDLTTLLAEVASQLADPSIMTRATPEISSTEVSGLESALSKLAGVASVGGTVATLFSAFDGSSNSTKREFEWNTEFDSVGSARPAASVDVAYRALKIPASLTTWLKNIGNVASIGAGGAAIVGAFDGGSNSTTLKRDFVQASNGVDLAGLLDGVTPKFEDRSFKASKAPTEVPPTSASTSEVSGLESTLSKLAGATSIGGAVASVLSGFGGSNNSTRRDIDLNIPEIMSALGLEPLQSQTIPTASKRSDGTGEISHETKRGISTDIDILSDLASVIEGVIGGSSSTSAPSKRFANVDDADGLTDSITLQQLQQIVSQAQLNTRMIYLD
jgi:hypothetical protein